MSNASGNWEPGPKPGNPDLTEYGFHVVITVPSSMLPEVVERDFRNSISFGRPVVTPLYVVPAPLPEPVATEQTARL